MTRDQVTVGFLGPVGSHHSQAAHKLDASVETTLTLVALPSASDVFHALDCGTIDYALTAVETNLCGMVEPHFRAVLDRDVEIRAAVTLRAEMVLATSRAVRIDEIEEVAAHPQAYAECREWLGAHLPGAAIRYCDSSARAAEMVGSSSSGRMAAICSPEAADRFGLDILETSVTDPPGDMTLFWLVGAARGLDIVATAGAYVVRPHADRPAELLTCLHQWRHLVTRVDSITRRQALGDYDYLVSIDVSTGQASEFELALRDIGSVRDLGRFMVIE